MNGKVTGNTMTMAHFHDFYYLEAMLAGLSMAKGANSEMGFRHSVERLENDLAETFAHVTKSMAFRIYVYLYAASLGEARHADDYCETYINELEGYGRSDVYDKSLEFFPSDNNLKTLRGIYEQKWSSGSYGGKAWLSIVDGMMLYGKITDAAFIDHAVDLEHNGGNVFTKGAKEATNLDCFGSTWDDSHYTASDLRYFLDYKFSHDILNDAPRFSSFKVSRKVYTLMTRYNNVVKPIRCLEFVNPVLEFLSDYAVDWGTQEFTVNTNEPQYSRCESCGERRLREEHRHVNGSCVCDSCYQEYSETHSTCEKCGNMVRGTQWVADADENWCDNCIGYYTSTCDKCLNTVEEFVTTKNACYCTVCKLDFGLKECEHCGEWTESLEEHVLENHYNPVPLAMDADGIFENMDEPLDSTQDFHLSGHPDVKIHVWSVEHSPIKIINLQEYKKARGEAKGDIKYIIVPPLGLWLATKNSDNLEHVKDVVKKITPMLEWENIQTVQDWQNVPTHIKDAIQKEALK